MYLFLIYRHTMCMRDYRVKHLIFNIKGNTLELVNIYTNNINKAIKDYSDHKGIIVFTLNIFIIHRIITLFIRIKKELFYLALLCILLLVIDHYIGIPRNIYIFIIILIFLKSIIYNRNH